MRIITILIFTISVLISLNLKCQYNYTWYKKYIRIADSLFIKQEYKTSAYYYTIAFNYTSGKALHEDRYKAASAFALSKNYDTSFYHLFRLAKVSFFSDVKTLVSDSNFLIIRNDKRWKELVDVVSKNYNYINSQKIKLIIRQLDSIHDVDQNSRKIMDSLIKEHGLNSAQAKKQYHNIRVSDSLNTILITKIIDDNGWLSKNIIGVKANSTLFLIIQHSKIEIQKKYLSVLQSAYLSGNAQSIEYAMLYDRVSVKQKGVQLYGTQIKFNETENKYELYPLIEPNLVDKYRNNLGLDSLKYYLTNWEIKFDLPQKK